MKIDPKYRLEEFPLNLMVIQAFDFELEPILLLEKDVIGNFYLSFLTFSDNEIEQRAYIQISKDRLNRVLANEISLSKAYRNPENDFVIIAEYFHKSGAIQSSYLLPSNEISQLEIIPNEYEVTYDSLHNNIVLDELELLNYSQRINKLVLDFYLKSKNLRNSIKPYAFYKIFTPLIEIMKSMLEFDGRNADKYLSFSNLRHSSLGVTIELNYSQDLFLEKESEVLEIIINLLNSQSKEDFEKVVYRTKNNKYLKYYKSIIGALIDNDADLHTAYANPILKTVKTSELNKQKAEVAQSLIDESLDVVEDVEEIKGTFLEIDIDRKEPSFKIFSFEDDFTLKGKFELSLVDKIKNDFVNIGKESYIFTIKTNYHPETTMKSEEINRFMINYQKI